MIKLINGIRSILGTRKHVVDYGIAFNANGGVEGVYNFLKEYIASDVMMLRQITENDILDKNNKPVAKALIAHVTTTQRTRRILEKSFGKYLPFMNEEDCA